MITLENMAKEALALKDNENALSNMTFSLTQLAQGYLDLLAEKNLRFESYCKLDDINEKLNEEITKLTQQLSEAKEVIEFYGDKNNYYSINDGTDYNPNYKCYESSDFDGDLEVGTNARAYLAKNKGDV